MARRMNRGRKDQIRDFVTEYIAKHGCSPTQREIGDAVGIKSPSTISDYLERMTRDGLITYIRHKSRSIQVVSAKPEREIHENRTSVLCTFILPEGRSPTNVIAVVPGAESDNAANSVYITAKSYEVLPTEAATTAEQE